MCGDENLKNEICYTGGIYDEGTGLYYLNARYYNPQDGRFLSQDTYRGEMTDYGMWNLYTYCANNPVNYIDPSGHAAVATVATATTVTIYFVIGMTVTTSYVLWQTIKGLYYCGRQIARVVVNYTYTTVAVPEAVVTGGVPTRTARIVGQRIARSVSSIQVLQASSKRADEEGYQESARIREQTNRKQKGKIPRNNQRQNKQARDAKRGRVPKSRNREYPDEVTGKNYSYQELLEIAEEYVKNRVKKHRRK